MKPSTVVGILLVLAGILCLAVGGFSFKHEKKDVDMGPIQIQHMQKKHVYIPPVFSGILLGSGLILLAVSASRR